ncbi:MAG TPA: diadenylate cyclase CdaA [Acidobacteriota bacterium]|nr:diadenylate cyclase CdaA [Acidobacteriota bacterium]
MNHWLAISIIGKEFGWNDLFDIIIVAFLIYQVLLIIKGTGAVQVGFGIVLLVSIFFVSQWLGLRTLHWTLTKIFPYLVFIVIILFQHEIRKAISVLGQNPLMNLFSARLGRHPLDEIILAVTSMSAKRIGSIVVLEREMGLKNYIEGGVALDAKVSYDLLMSVFNPASPLHDGAVIIQRGRISAAACFLPLTMNPYLARELGSRHRAAIGLSEETDAMIIVVSEETGKISLVQNEEMITELDGPELKKLLTENMPLSGQTFGKRLFRKDAQQSL